MDFIYQSQASARRLSIQDFHTAYVYKMYYNNPWYFDEATVSMLKSDRETLPDVSIWGLQCVADGTNAEIISNRMLDPMLSDIGLRGISSTVPTHNVNVDALYLQAVRNNDIAGMMQALRLGTDVTTERYGHSLAWHTFQTANMDLICCLVLANRSYAEHAVYFAIVYNNMYALEWLLALPGVQINLQTDPQLGTPLELAASYGRHLAICVLLQHGAKITDTAFVTVCRQRMYAIFNTFINNGYDVSRVCDRLYTECVAGGQTEIAIYMRARCAPSAKTTCNNWLDVCLWCC